MYPTREPERSSSDPRVPDEIESGAWGTVAVTLLVVLFVLAAAATVHSVFVTF